MADFVVSATYQDNLSAGMNAAAAAMQKAADAADSVEAKVTKVGASADNLVRRFDPATAAAAKLTRAQAELAAATTTLDAAVAAGTKTVDQRNAVVDALSARVQALTTAMAAAAVASTGTEDAYSRIAAAAAAMADANARAVQFQNALNQSLNVQTPGANSYQSRASDIQAYGQALDALRAKYDPVFAVSKQYSDTLDEIAYAQKVGALSADQAALAQERITAAFAKANSPAKEAAAAVDKVAESHNNTSMATRQLGVQFSQFFSGIATGQPVIMSLVQQGHQVGDVMLSTGTGVKQLAGAVAGLITPTVAITAGIAAAAAGIAYLGYSAETNERNLSSLQTALRATRDDFTAMAAEADKAAKSVAATTGFSTADAQAAAKTITTQPSFVGNQQQLQALIVESGDLAAVMGTTLPAAAAKLAAAMQDPGKAADELASTHFRGMNQALADAITLQAQAGDKAGAFAKFLDAVKSSTSGAADASKTELQQALDHLREAFTATGADGKSFAQVLGEAVTGAASAAVNALASVVRGIENARESVSGIVNAPPSNSQSVLTNPQSGAMGIFQLMPKTAAGMHVDPTDANQNIYGGLSYIQDLQNRYHGNTASMLAEYGGYGHDTAAAAGYIAKVQNADTSALNNQTVMNGSQKMTTAQAIQFWGDTLGLDANTVALGLKIAAVESGGRQYGGATAAAAGVASAVDLSMPIPPIPPGTGGDANGVKNDPITEAYDRAKKSASYQITQTGAGAAADITLYTDALAKLAQQGDTASAKVQMFKGALNDAQVALQNAKTPADTLVASLGRQADAQAKIADAYSGGMSAVNHMTNLTRAEEDARKMAGVTTENYAATVLKLVAAYDQVTAAQQRTKAGDLEFGQGQQSEYLQAELSLVTASADQRERDLAALRMRQQIAREMPDLEAAEKDKLIANAQAIADATTQLQKQQQTLSDISGMVTQVADQLGNAITQAFVQGQGAAVNWGNITRGIIASVVQELLKLAVINPILNATLGQNKTTLGDVGGLLGGSSGSGSGGFSLSGLSNLYSNGKSLYNTVSGGTVSPFVDSIGASSGLFNSFAPAAYAALPEGVSGPVAGAADTGLFGATASSAFTGIGAGFAAGSLVGGLTQNAFGKTGPGAMAGAATGAVAGAAIGSIIPGVGTVVGGLVGGIIGGGGGGLIGPHKQSAWNSTFLDLQGGQLAVTGSTNQLDASNRADTVTDAQTINAFLQANGVSISSLGMLRQVGIGGQTNAANAGGFADAGKFTGLASGFGQLRFGAANDNTLNGYLSGKSYGDLATFETDVATYKNLVNSTIPALTKQTTVTGSLNDALAQINASFGPAITAAQQYGVATDALTAAQQKAINTAQDAVNKQTNQMHQGWTAAYMGAAASISGNPADQENTQLYAFDVSAKQQKDQLDQYLVGVYGDSVRTWQGYADEMAFLDKSLGEQRLAIQKSYNDKLAQTATSAVTNLASYVSKLQTGSASPLSVTDQYGLASSQFNAVAGSAQAGNWNSYQNITGYADTLLSTSRAVNGSGAQYVADFNRVLDALSSLSSETPDTLTASIYQSEMQTQTQVLSDALAAVRTEVAALRTVVQQGASAPARVAA